MVEHYRIIFETMGTGIWNRKTLWPEVRRRMKQREMDMALTDMLERDEIIMLAYGKMQIRAGVSYHVRLQQTAMGDIAGPREITNRSMREPLTGTDPVLRPGAEDFMRCPSRRGRLLYYRDGRVERLEG